MSSKKIPETFPDIEVLENYVAPVTSERLGRDVDTDRMWRKEGDIVKIAQCCELYFEWGYKDMIIKRFRTFLWAGVCMRALRRAVMDSDEKEVDAYRRNRNYQDSDGDDIMATPRKTGRRAHEFAVGTPSGLIQHYFKDMRHLSPSKSGRHFGDEHGDEYGGEGKKLLTRITRSREHASTDGLLEYRVEVDPAPLVRLAESGIRGMRVPVQDDLDLETGEDEDEGDEGEGGSKKKKLKRPPPEPEEPMLQWLPAVMLEMAEPGLVEEFERIEGTKERKRQETEQRKKDRTEGKVVPRQPKAKNADAEAEGGTTPTQRKHPITTKKKDGQSQAGAIPKTFKITKKKALTERDKGKGKNKFIMPSSDKGDSDDGDQEIPTSQTPSTSIAIVAPKPTAKGTLVDELLDGAIDSSSSKAPHQTKYFDTVDENPFLDSIPASSAKKSKGKTRPAIVAAPKPKSKASNSSAAPTQTARERTKLLFTQNPDYFSPSPSPEPEEDEGDLLDPYAGLTSISPVSANKRTISASTKASGSGSSRSNSTGSAVSVGVAVAANRATVEEEVESFEDVFADTTPVAASKRPKPHPKAQESTTSNMKPLRFVLPESPNPERCAPAPSKPRGKEKKKARSASSASSTATAEDTDEGDEGGVRKKSRALDSPWAGDRVELLGLRAEDALAPPVKKGHNRVIELVELYDSDEDEALAPEKFLFKPTINKKKSKENARGISRGKAKVADLSIIDLDSD